MKKPTQKEAFHAFCHKEDLGTFSIKFQALKAVPREWSSDWLESRRQQYSAVTFNEWRRLMRKFGEWAVAQNLVESNPYQKMKLKKRDLKDVALSKKRDPFTVDEIAKLKEVFLLPRWQVQELFPRKFDAILHYEHFIMFMLYTGCRPSEAIGLRPIDINFDRNLITIQESVGKILDENGKAATGRKTTKCGETKKIPIPEQLNTWLKERYDHLCASRYTENTRYIFVTHTGATIDISSFGFNIWKPLLTALGIPYRVPYALRHTFASHAVAQGMSLPQLAQFMGHKDSSMIYKRYAHSLEVGELPKL